MILYSNRGILGLLIFWNCSEENVIFRSFHGNHGNYCILFAEIAVLFNSDIFKKIMFIALLELHILFLK